MSAKIELALENSEPEVDSPETNDEKTHEISTEIKDYSLNRDKNLRKKLAATDQEDFFGDRNRRRSETKNEHWYV
jgi:hypothetical protein